MTSLHERPTWSDRPTWLPADVWPFEVRAMNSGAGRVSFTDTGQGPTLLFAHAGMWSFLWRDVIVELSRQYRCVALDDVTLVLHDLGGPAALAAVSGMPERVAGIAAVNTFGWRPTGVLFRTMLAVFGSWWMREIDAHAGWLPAASTTRFGVGRHLDRPSRRAFRAGMDREARRTMHLLFRSARGSEQVFSEAAHAVEALADRSLLTVFGQLGDYLRFRPKWRARFKAVTEVTIPRGLHFPMCDAPTVTADAIDRWHRDHIAPAIRRAPRSDGYREGVG